MDEAELDAKTMHDELCCDSPSMQGPANLTSNSIPTQWSLAQTYYRKLDLVHLLTIYTWYTHHTLTPIRIYTCYTHDTVQSNLLLQSSASFYIQHNHLNHLNHSTISATSFILIIHQLTIHHESTKSVFHQWQIVGQVSQIIIQCGMERIDWKHQLRQASVYLNSYFWCCVLIGLFHLCFIVLWCWSSSLLLDSLFGLFVFRWCCRRCPGWCNSLSRPWWCSPFSNSSFAPVVGIACSRCLSGVFGCVLCVAAAQVGVFIIFDCGFGVCDVDSGVAVFAHQRHSSVKIRRSIDGCTFRNRLNLDISLWHLWQSQSDSRCVRGQIFNLGNSHYFACSFAIDWNKWNDEAVRYGCSSCWCVSLCYLNFSFILSIFILHFVILILE